MDTTAADMPQRRTFSGRWVAIAAGIVALVAFFFPWINYQDRAYSGFEFAQAMGGVTKGFDVTLYAIPVLAIMVIAFALVSMLNDSEGGAIFNNWTILAAVSGLLISAVFLAEKALSGEKALETLRAGELSGFGPGVYASIIMFAIAAIGGALEWRRAVARERAAWRTQDFVLLAILAIVFGAIYWQWIQVWIWAQALGAQFGRELFFGVWFVAGLLGGYIVRRPGAAFLAESLAALAEVLLGCGSRANPRRDRHHAGSGLRAGVCAHAVPVLGMDHDARGRRRDSRHCDPVELVPPGVLRLGLRSPVGLTRHADYQRRAGGSGSEGYR